VENIREKAEDVSGGLEEMQVQSQTTPRATEMLRMPLVKNEKKFKKFFFK